MRWKKKCKAIGLFHISRNPLWTFHFYFSMQCILIHFIMLSSRHSMYSKWKFFKRFENLNAQWWNHGNENHHSDFTTSLKSSELSNAPDVFVIASFNICHQNQQFQHNSVKAAAYTFGGFIFYYEPLEMILNGNF